MIDLNAYLKKLKISSGDSGNKIWDPVRKKWLKTSPEELVRQSVILYLCAEKKYPLGLMSVEKTIRVHSRLRRYDLLVHTRTGAPVLLVECKEPRIQIQQAEAEQISLYNLELKVPFLWITNGIDHYIYQIDLSVRHISRIDDLPSFLGI